MLSSVLPTHGHSLHLLLSTCRHHSYKCLNSRLPDLDILVPDFRVLVGKLVQALFASGGVSFLSTGLRVHGPYRWLELLSFTKLHLGHLF